MNLPDRMTQFWIYRVLLFCSDAAMLISALFLSYWLRFELQLTLHAEVVPSVDFYFNLSVFLIPIWLLLFILVGLYDSSKLLGGAEEYALVATACTGASTVVAIATFLIPELVVARAWLIFAWLSSMLFVCLARFLLRRIAYRLRSSGWFAARTALIGSDVEIRELYDNLRITDRFGFELIGFVSTAPNPALIDSPLPCLGNLPNLKSLIQRHQIEELIVSTASLGRSQLRKIFELGSESPGIGMHFSIGLFELMTSGFKIKTIGAAQLLQIGGLRLRPGQRFLKRVLDISVSFVLILLLSPLFLLVISLIKAGSEGPALYRRRVLGRGGREFDALKFRSMLNDGDRLLEDRQDLQQELEANHKLRSDPRVTRVGCWLRRYSMDELPQLINVLRGQMSLVGPRMITRDELRKYGVFCKNLLSVKPGITGLWQVSGRSDLSYEERINLDMHYIRYYSFWRDLQILLVQTLPAVIKGRGAR